MSAKLTGDKLFTSNLWFGDARHANGTACAARRAGRRSRRAAPRTAKPATAIDVTGYWVSVVTEDWRYRMVTPTKGDYQGVPMTPAKHA